MTNNDSRQTLSAKQVAEVLVKIPGKKIVFAHTTASRQQFLEIENDNVKEIADKLISLNFGKMYYLSTVRFRARFTKVGNAQFRFDKPLV